MNKRHLRSARLLLLLLPLALLAAACGDGGDGGESASTSTSTAPTTEGDSASAGGLDDLVTAAKEEGSVVLYSAYNAEISQALADAFTDEYGISVEVVRQASADLNARFAAEAEAGAVAADVLWQPDDVFADAATDNGWLAEIDEESVPGLDAVPADERAATYVPVLIQPWGIAYNTTMLSADDAPQSWEDLAEGDKIEGGLLVADPGNSVSTSAVYDFWLEEYGEGFFVDLAATQQFGIGDSVSNAVQQVAAGEVAAFVPAPLSTVANAKASGAPIEVVIPDDTTGFSMLAAVASDAAHPNAARLLVSFLLSDDGQSIAVADIAIPVVDSVESTVERPAGYVPSDNARTAQRLDELTKLLGA